MDVATDPVALAAALHDRPSLEIMDRALAGGNVAISFSGAEDVLLIEYAQQTGRPFQVFSLDTGRLHPETYRYLEQVATHYRIVIEYLFPDRLAVEAMVGRKGLFSFFKDGHRECCGIRKVEPLRRKLSTLDGWITGQRRDQSQTRTQVSVVERDQSFRGREGGDLIKWNPLANVSSADVWLAIRGLGVPYNPLHERGFVSIGCEPCTRPVLPGQHEREGRWWWEEIDHKECGLHEGNLNRPKAPSPPG